MSYILYIIHTFPIHTSHTSCLIQKHEKEKHAHASHHSPWPPPRSRRWEKWKGWSEWKENCLSERWVMSNAWLLAVCNIFNRHVLCKQRREYLYTKLLHLDIFCLSLHFFPFSSVCLFFFWKHAWEKWATFSSLPPSFKKAYSMHICALCFPISIYLLSHLLSCSSWCPKL